MIENHESDLIDHLRNEYLYDILVELVGDMVKGADDALHTPRADYHDDIRNLFVARGRIQQANIIRNKLKELRTKAKQL